MPHYEIVTSAQQAYVFVVSITIVLSLALAVVGWRWRAQPGGLPLVLLMSAISLWSASSIFEYVAVEPATRIMWAQIGYIGITTSPAFTVMFAFEYTGQHKWTSPRPLLALLTVPAVITLLAFTNSWHHLIWTGFTPQPGTHVLIYHHGYAFWLLVIYVYICLATSSLLLIREAIHRRHIYRHQAIVSVLSMIPPWLANVFYVFDWGPPGWDLTPVFFAISGIILTWNFARLQFIYLVPVARDRAIERMRDGVLVLDELNRIVDINPGAKKLLGDVAQGVIGKRIEDVTPRHADLIHSLFSEPEATAEIATEGGVPVELRVSSLFEGGNRLAGRVVTMLDISDRKQAQALLQRSHDRLEKEVAERTAALQAANEELVRSARHKDEFLATMSHELRTPLTAVLGLSEALQFGAYGPLMEKQAASVARIESSGRHLLALINDILDISTIEAGKLTLDKQPVAVAQICRSALDMIHPMAEAKNIDLSFICSDDAVVFPADMRRLRQVLLNLLSNAVKFTPEGGRVGLEVRSMTDTPAIHMCVWDTGIGIAETDRDRIFQPFVQLDGRLARQYEGTGLGLALASRLTELHGGHIEVESNPTQGSRFTVVLPLPEPDSRAV